MPWTYYLTDEQREHLHSTTDDVTAAMDRLKAARQRVANATQKERKDALQEARDALRQLIASVDDLTRFIKEGLYGTETPDAPELTPSSF